MPHLKRSSSVSHTQNARGRKKRKECKRERKRERERERERERAGGWRDEACHVNALVQHALVRHVML